MGKGRDALKRAQILMFAAENIFRKILMLKKLFRFCSSY